MWFFVFIFTNYALTQSPVGKEQLRKKVTTQHEYYFIGFLPTTATNCKYVGLYFIIIKNIEQ
jgi:hypothetical protein